MRALVWFRSDLRTADQPALFEACRTATRGVVAVFAICPDQWREHDRAPVKVDFLVRNLAALRQELLRLGIPLRVVEAPRFADVPARLLEVADRHGCDGLWFNLEYEVDERRRDQRVTELFEAAGRSVHTSTDQVVVPPDAVRTQQGGFYTVFTPFKRRWIATVTERGETAPLPAPRPLRSRPGLASDPVPDEVPGFSGLTRPDLWPAGEAEAGARLRAFVETRLSGYDTDRDLPGCAGTSQLSPYLALGVVSARQCLRAALDANDDRFDGGSAGVVTWISELVWREFYRHVLVGHPWVCMDQPFDTRTASIPWRDDDAGFERWTQGRTGIPIVDAGMRQLLRTGWMHNRVRMITAMFLTKNLFLDWRRGEAWFMRNLVDGDFASNNGGWQWCASVGTDPAPYFRVFNPVRQSQRFDPDGDYIRRFVPELAKVAGAAIHLPAPGAAPDYPPPIVDLKRSRQRAIDTFREHAAPRD